MSRNTLQLSEKVRVWPFSTAPNSSEMNGCPTPPPTPEAAAK
ncbi:hypothetical protein [Streptomyces natalensis]|nr:hypothetical protein [Streptomyces natalensis]